MPPNDAATQPYPTRIEALSRPIHRPVTYLKRAGIAASYPIRGIWYYLRNREFWPLFSGRIMPLSIISFLVYFVLFTFAFLPQFAFLALFHGWGAWVNAVVLVLGEGLVIIQGLFEGFFVDEARVDVFDATLINYSLTDLVSPHRILFPDAPNSVKMLGKPTSSAVYTPWSLTQIAELIFFLPLNLIPYVGTPAFIIITGARLGKLAHYRWFQLKGLTKDQQKKELRDRTWEYVWFGTVAMILELIPILSLFFLLTTSAGSAMWVARIEEERKRRDVEDLVGPDAAPPPYTYSDDVV
ncbi:Fc.00g012500.m01.CDS01 [Cosmosporella sp. VM-42]